MIKDFETIQAQLLQLKDVVNGYKSEAVQLKIIEALLARMGVDATSIRTPPKQEVELKGPGSIS